MKYNLLGAVSTLAMGAALGLTVVAPASATVINESDNWSYGPPTYAGKQTESFAGFTAPGTLNSVVVTYTITSDKISNNASATVTTGSANNMQGNGALGVVAAPFGLTLATVTLTTPAYTGPIAVGRASYGKATFSPLPVTETQTLTGASLTAFETSGTLHITLFATNSVTGSSFTGTVSTGVTGSATGSLALSYNYTPAAPPPPPPPSPTPEPASLALLGVGLVGLGAIRRRRKA
jgi:PEP-CTERM motif